MSTELNKLEQEAKEAQRKYDKAKQTQKGEAKMGTIITTSTKEGFKFDCNAGSDLLVKHTVATVKRSLEVLEDRPVETILLVMELMNELSSLAEDVKKKL